MNERIRDLKEQALIWAIETLDPDALNDNEWGVAIDEKFAELIVRDCVGILEPKSRYMGEGPEVLKDKIRQIKKHFGVKE